MHRCKMWATHLSIKNVWFGRYLSKKNFLFKMSGQQVQTHDRFKRAFVHL